jgi:xanthine dehydrogenase YagT iron-sulfur-binding subunit
VAAIREAAEGRPSAVTPPGPPETPVRLSEEEVRERMSGNLCRCAAYPGIAAAVLEASR